MHTIELLEQALAVATDAGCVVRQEWLNGATAGACEIKGRRYLFVDLALSPGEQLDQVLDALARWSSPPALLPFPQLQALVARRKAA
jgi:hypothetical protein